MQRRKNINKYRQNCMNDGKKTKLINEEEGVSEEQTFEQKLLGARQWFRLFISASKKL